MTARGYGTARRVRWLSLLAFSASFACSANPGAELEDEGLVARADFSEAKQLVLGVDSEGESSGNAFTLFQFPIEEGDQLEIEVRRTWGTFDPETVLYDHHYEPIRHASFARLARSEDQIGNIKRYDIGARSGTARLVVKAHGGQGYGGFRVVVRCVDGPCAGETPELRSNEMAAICMGKARTRVFDRLADEQPADLDAARAMLKAALQAELEAGMEECLPSLCDDDQGDVVSPKGLCDLMGNALVFYATQSEDCRYELTSCLDTCNAYEENSPWLDLDDDEFEFWMGGEPTCWNSYYGEAGMSCDDFARGSESCGGNSFKVIDGVDSTDTCYVRWRATQGAWREFEDDNLDCSETCQAIEECDAGCGELVGTMERRVCG